MSAKKSSDDAEVDHDPTAGVTDEAQREESPAKQESKPEPPTKPEIRPAAKTRVRAENEPTPAHKTEPAKGIAGIMKFDLRTRRKPRR